MTEEEQRELDGLVRWAYGLIYSDWSGCTAEAEGRRWMAAAERAVPGIEERYA